MILEKNWVTLEKKWEGSRKYGKDVKVVALVVIRGPPPTPRHHSCLGKKDTNSKVKTICKVRE